MKFFVTRTLIQSARNEAQLLIPAQLTRRQRTYIVHTYRTHTHTRAYMYIHILPSHGREREKVKLAVCAREGKRCMCMHAVCFFSVSRGRQGGSCANTRACVRAVAFYAPLYVAARVRRSREVVFFFPFRVIVPLAGLLV